MKDIYNNVLTKQTLPPALRTTTATGTAVDRAEDQSYYQDALILITTGAITDGTHTAEVQDSDDNVTYAPVADAYLQGAEPVIVAASDNATYELGYLGRKRYLRVVITASGTTTGGLTAASVILSNPRVAPVVRN